MAPSNPDEQLAGAAAQQPPDSPPTPPGTTAALPDSGAPAPGSPAEDVVYLRVATPWTDHYVDHVDEKSYTVDRTPTAVPAGVADQLIEQAQQHGESLLKVEA